MAVTTTVWKYLSRNSRNTGVAASFYTGNHSFRSGFHNKIRPKWPKLVDILIHFLILYIPRFSFDSNIFFRLRR